MRSEKGKKKKNKCGAALKACGEGQEDVSEEVFEVAGSS